jgi:hypothetical protein
MNMHKLSICMRMMSTIICRWKWMAFYVIRDSKILLSDHLCTRNWDDTWRYLSSRCNCYFVSITSSSANSAMQLLSHEICDWVVADKCGVRCHTLNRLRKQQVSRRGIQVMDGSAIATESSRVWVLIVLCRVDRG